MSLHLPGDPGPLGGRGEGTFLVPLAFQPCRAVVQFGEAGTAGGGVQAESEGCGNQAGQEDRVVPPAAAGEPDHGGDHDELEHGGA
ncbi:MAG: hypothetical protein ACRDND_34350, partial [Streptosporangiaceae bacterium]